MWRLVTRNWWTSPGRTLAMVTSVAVGVAVVVLITGAYETARRMIQDQVLKGWLGAAHLSIQPAGAHWGALDASLADELSGLENVVLAAPRLQRRMLMLSPRIADGSSESPGRQVDVVGIEPEKETAFGRIFGMVGRMMKADERGVAILDDELIREWDLSLDDSVTFTPHRGGPQVQLRIIGSFEPARIAEFQRPIVYAALADIQEIHNESGKATAIDLMLRDSSAQTLRETQRVVEEKLAARGESRKCRVESAAAIRELFGEADRITRLVLTVVTGIVMLTSFFIILSTMSVSLFARRIQLGTMRCVGVTRGQLSALVFAEVIPPACLGISLGVAGAVVLLKQAPGWLRREDIQIEIGAWGLGLATASGLATSLACCLILCLQINRVSPLAATTPHARPPRLWIALVSGIAGAALLGLHEALVRFSDPERWLTPWHVTIGGCALYGGYVAIAPFLVVGAGPTCASLLGRLAGLHPSLTTDLFRRTPWRATAACWVMTVGVALIVYHIVATEAIRAIWNFPGRLPEAFVWTPRPVDGSILDSIRQLEVIGRLTGVVDVDCTIETVNEDSENESQSFIDRMLSKISRPVFVASEPDALLSILKIEFVEGNAEEARRRLAAGGHVLVPSQTAKQLRIRLNDRITVHIRGKSAEFVVAGVIQSPALDLTVTMFQATSYMQFAAAAAVLGTNADLAERFGLELVSMLMADLHLPKIATPPEFLRPEPPNPNDVRAVVRFVVAIADQLPEERETLESLIPQVESLSKFDQEVSGQAVHHPDWNRFVRATRAVYWTWKRLSPEENWHRFRERLVLHRIAERMERPDAILGSLHRLKRETDRAVSRATVVLTWLPSILLVVAMIGISNLMMVGVQVRARQFAMLRAVGAQQSQIVRLVLVEAAAVGVVGSVVGILLGLHQAATDNRIYAGLFGFRAEYIVPPGPMTAALALTVAVCLLAGIAPARRAARCNVIAALQAT
jgi:ABC-type lipoprotein release transport system permease subunit